MEVLESSRAAVSACASWPASRAPRKRAWGEASALISQLLGGVFFLELALRLAHRPRLNEHRKRPRRGRGEEPRRTVTLRGQLPVGER
jgi:hypothetical protein